MWERDEPPAASSVEIRPLTGPRGSLQLQGSILTYRERYWIGERCVDIPIELVSFSGGRAFKGSRLIAALLSLLLLPTLGAALFAASQFFAGPPPHAIVGAFVGVTVLATVVTFLVLLIRFFIRQETMSMHVSPMATFITFWMDGREAAHVRRLVDEVRVRQAAVAEAIAFPIAPIAFPLGDAADRLRHPWRRTFILICLFITPALITEIPLLLLAGLIPLGLQAHASVMRAKMPKAFRQAVNSFRKGESSQALDLIHQLLLRTPDHRPSRLFRIELLLRLGDFAGASAALAPMASDLDDETLQIIEQDISLRRRLWERKRE